MEKKTDVVEKKDELVEKVKQTDAEIKEMNVWQRMSAIQGMNIQINKDKAAHGYSYATLDQIMDKLNPLLNKYRLLVTHFIDYDKEEKMSYVKTVVMNVDKPTEELTSTTYIDKDVTLPGQNKVMVIGSQITYYRRYHVTSLFGLTTETDTDAGGAIPNRGAKASGSVESAGSGEKAVDFVAIFKNMIAKGKDKPTVEKQFTTYKSKMSEEQITEVTKLITEIK